MEKAVLVIPAYNEEKTIGKVVAGAKAYAEVLVVDDCSSDRTAETAERAGARVLRNEHNTGYEQTLNRGVAEAAKTADIILMMDADGQHEPAEMRTMMDLIEKEGYDAVFGRRPWHQRTAESLYAVFSKWKTGVEDPLCGFRAFRASAYKKIGFFDRIGSTGTEFLFACKKNGLKVGQMDITFYRRSDQPRFERGRRLRAEAKIVGSMLKVMRKYMFA